MYFSYDYILKKKRTSMLIQEIIMTVTSILLQC